MLLTVCVDSDCPDTSLDTGYNDLVLISACKLQLKALIGGSCTAEALVASFAEISHTCEYLFLCGVLHNNLISGLDTVGLDPAQWTRPDSNFN